MKYSDLCGYKYHPAVIDEVAKAQAFPCFGDANASIKGTGKGKDIFLWEIERKLTGKVRDPHEQTQPDCVSHGLSGAAEDLLFIQIARGESSTWEPIASEPIYAGSRHQIGQDQLGQQGGSVPGWGIQWGQKYGFMPRRSYPTIDLSRYDGNLAAQWGRPGVGTPNDLAEDAKQWPLVTCSLIQGQDKYSQAIDVLANQGLIVTGSTQLYSQVRDQFGFCTPDGQPAGHCTYYRGFTDNARRPGIAYQQSWGNLVPRGNQTITLPNGNRVNLPLGCFFIDADEFNTMHNQQYSEVWAITKEAGWAPNPTDFTISFI